MKIIDSLPKLKGFIPDSIIAQLPDVCVKFDIDGPLRMSHFIGQTREETGNYTRLTENLYYTDATRVAQIFRGDFDLDHDRVIEPNEIEFAKNYLRNPEKMANYVYANLNGHGNEVSGDGWKYRGRGALQTTGRANYKALGDFLGVDLISNPDLVATTYAMSSAAFYFKNGGLWTICDKGVDVPTITTLTKKVNGGTTNLDVRIQYTQQAYNLLHG